MASRVKSPLGLLPPEKAPKLQVRVHEDVLVALEERHIRSRLSREELVHNALVSYLGVDDPLRPVFSACDVSVS